ncbi:hypothetical protein NHQ30_002919 [Ciborinia camelliae]|nr:hypothetical protein NHQ30_002919 [Ciborinia camelliae]
MNIREIFLRVLEYYRGILFLTTNRVGAFDEAFTSRIHVSLYYPQLDLNSTLEIFKMNMGRISDRFAKKKRDFAIEELDIRSFAIGYFQQSREGRWNGRQIRNAFQTAVALAEYDVQGEEDTRSHTDKIDKKLILKASHFETVADAYLGFVNYLKEVNHGVGAAKRAHDRSYRDDEFGQPKGSSWGLLSERRGSIQQTSQATKDPFYSPRRQPDHDFQDERPLQFAQMAQSGVPNTNYDQPYHDTQYQDPRGTSSLLNRVDRQQPLPTELSRGNDFTQSAYNLHERHGGRGDQSRNYTFSNERVTLTNQDHGQPHQSPQVLSTPNRTERHGSPSYSSYPPGPGTLGVERRVFYPEDNYGNQ